VNIIWACN